MNGLNARFMKKGDTPEFLRQVVIIESQALSAESQPKVQPNGRGPFREGFLSKPGVYSFDLESVVGYSTAVYLRQAPADAGEAPIRAYWLPWKSRETMEIELANEANYFFTSHLGGCQLRIVPPNPPDTNIKVLHIAGDTGGTKGAGSEGKKWRTEQAEKALKSDLGRSRAFSSTEEINLGGYKGFGDVTVAGYKGKYGWELWAQVSDESGFKVKPDGGVWRFY